MYDLLRLLPTLHILWCSDSCLDLGSDNYLLLEFSFLFSVFSPVQHLPHTALTTG